MVQAKQLASNAIITITFATNISYQNLFMFLPKVKKSPIYRSTGRGSLVYLSVARGSGVLIPALY